MFSSMEDSIESMKKNGAPSAVIKSMERDLKEFQAHQSEINISTSQATDEDKKFVRDNLDWLVGTMPGYEDGMNHDGYVDDHMGH